MTESTYGFTEGDITVEVRTPYIEYQTYEGDAPRHVQSGLHEIYVNGTMVARCDTKQLENVWQLVWNTIGVVRDNG